MCCFPNIWKVLPETMTLSTMRFFPVHDGTKSALTMRENLPFSVKSVLSSKNLYRADCCVKRKNRVVQDGKKVYLQSGLSKNAKQVRRSARCVLLSIRRISSAFYVQENAVAVLRLLMTRAVHLYIRLGRGEEGSVFRKTNSVDGRGAVFPLCGVFSYLHL